MAFEHILTILTVLRPMPMVGKTWALAWVRIVARALLRERENQRIVSRALAREREMPVG